MEMIGEFGREDVAKVYVSSMREGGQHVIEFVESLQPPIPRDEKWVLIVSSSFGCPMSCMMCDAGGQYLGPLETDEIMAQIDYMVNRRFPSRKVPVKKFKVQFARMGEPSLNMNVIDALELMTSRYDAPGMMACVSTIAPHGSEKFFDRLTDVKNNHYAYGRFQIQFSIHSTDTRERNRLIPGRKWDLTKISRFGEKFYEAGDRKITLNFAIARTSPIDPDVIAQYFDPEKFIIKLTPLNPTARAQVNMLESGIDPENPAVANELIGKFSQMGFEAILSIGELEENKIGSNCGQYVGILRNSKLNGKGGYETMKYQLV